MCFGEAHDINFKKIKNSEQFFFPEILCNN